MKNTTTTNEIKAIRIKTDVKAGGAGLNHNEADAIEVSTDVRAGGVGINHNERS